MLIEFSVENFACFKDRTTFSMVASTAKEHPEHVFEYRPETAKRAKPIPLLKSAVMYGPNASGKSYFIKAIAYMRSMVLRSAKGLMSDETLPIIPFMLNRVTIKKPTLFEIVFVKNSIRYRYGFIADANAIHSEWLYFAPRGRESELFSREKGDIRHRAIFKGATGIDRQTRNNALYLSTSAQFNVEIAKDVYDYFSSLTIITSDEGMGNEFLSLKAIEEDDESRLKIIEFLKAADFGIIDLKIQDLDLEKELPPKFIVQLKKNYPQDIGAAKPLRVKGLYSVHRAFNKKKEPSGTVAFSFNTESQGTRRFFELAGPITNALRHGTTLIMDEFDNSLHQLLSDYIIKFFHSPEKNINNAQFIFSTHDTHFLSKHFFRRDQIWFFDKNDVSESKLYSLFDFSIKSRDNYDAKYLAGMFGAIPLIRELDLLSPRKEESSRENEKKGASHA